MPHLVKTKTHVDDKNRWGTDPLAFNDAKKLTGLSFILDACAETATKKCEFFISPDEDALSLTTCWKTHFALANKATASKATLAVSKPSGIWCNPPFDYKPEFIQKSHDVAKAHRIPVVMMLPYERQTIWWQCMVHGVASKVFIPDRRYQYVKTDGKTLKKGVNFGSCFVLFDGSFFHETQYIDFNVAELRASSNKIVTNELLERARLADSVRRSRSTKIA